MGTPDQGSVLGFVSVFVPFAAAVWARRPQRPRSRWSARSAARTNDLDGGCGPPHAGGSGERNRGSF